MNFQDYLNLCSKNIKSSLLSLLSFFLISLVSLLAIYTLTDIYTNNDNVLTSSKSILNDENIQFEIRTNEAKFRDQLNERLKALYNDKNFVLIDTVTKNSKEANDVKKYIILNKLKTGKTTVEFYSKVEKLSSPLMEIKGLRTKLEIDFDKLNNIIQSSKLDLNEDSIKYGNYLKTEYDLDKQLRIDYLIIAMFLVVCSVVFLYFKNKIGLKNTDELKDTVNELNSDRAKIEIAKKILDKNKVSRDEIVSLQRLVYQLEESLKKYDFDNILKSVLYVDVAKSERKSLELYNRSTLMLILGLLIAIVGILVFYFTLPEFKSVTTPTHYLALTIRPTLLLLFVQSISFYLLRQYRSLINDYKYFYEEYLRKSKTFVTYQLMQNKNITDVEMKLIDSLLKPEIEEHFGHIEDEVFSKDQAIDIIKFITEKLK
jgi:hypothetical protein